jgi:hypothetical protein
VTVLRQIGDAHVHRGRRAREGDRLAVQADLPTVRSIEPEGTPEPPFARPTSPARPRISPVRTEKLTSRKVLTGSAHRPRGRCRRRARPWGRAIRSARPCDARSAVVSRLVSVVITWRPSRKTVARSHRSKTSSSRWLTKRTATPRARRPRTMTVRRSTSWAESDAVGSSRMSTRASTESALRSRSTAGPPSTGHGRAPRRRSGHRAP